ncbi:hypothetical protein FGO68_gene15433 [Halteria grandinella]|uniref:Uncharacterized protein n=1 Tax=Halteria grandinella TaxID=5974 RepID=A0A8J8NS89_HALGN|nr:hypothetical protein FGO68_gene15433 [Halteria grandinella]
MIDGGDTLFSLRSQLDLMACTQSFSSLIFLFHRRYSLLTSIKDVQRSKAKLLIEGSHKSSKSRSVQTGKGQC